jgi:polysaccharide pyruvyl transferase CsaB
MALVIGVNRCDWADILAEYLFSYPHTVNGLFDPVDEWAGFGFSHWSDFSLYCEEAREMKVLISGYYGFGNVGDEAVLQSIIQGLKKNDLAVDITVLSAAPKITAELNQVKSIFRYNAYKVLQALVGCDVFISGGGTLFQNSTSNFSFFYYIKLVILAKLLRKKVAVFGQGFGPLTGKFNHGLASFALNRVDIITLRDQIAFDRLRELGVTNPNMHVTADPTLLLPTPGLDLGRRLLSLEAISLDKPLLGISVRNLPGKKEEKLYQSLAGAIDWLVQTYGYTPVFILFECPTDMAETSKVLNYMREKANVVFKICRPDEMRSLIANCDLLIAMRLHALIFAAASAVPLLGLSYDPKVTAFMKHIDQPCFEINDNLNTACLKLILEEMIKNKTKIKGQLQSSAAVLRGQAEMNFKLFSEKFQHESKS